MVYLDNAATTKIHPKAYEAMKQYLIDDYYNPNGLYKNSAKVLNMVESSREIVANSLGVSPEEIYFTSGGSEANSWALCGVLKPGDHLITSSIEHKSILKACEYLKSINVDIDVLDVNSDGFISVEDVVRRIKKNTKLVSIMKINNEIGTIQPVEELYKVLNKKGILLHTDAVQAYCHIPMNPSFDMMSASAHKFGGPKGVGFLYVKKGIDIKPLIFGGSQEHGLRGGTTNAAGIIGMATAVENSLPYIDIALEKIEMTRDYLLDSLTEFLTDYKINGSMDNRYVGNLNICINGIDAKQIIASLGDNDIMISSGSARNSGNPDPSHVLKAIGLTDEEANSSIRISLSKFNSISDIDEFCQNLKFVLDNI